MANPPTVNSWSSFVVNQWLMVCWYRVRLFADGVVSGGTIKGPDNPTSQLLPIMSFKGCSGVGEGRKDKGGGERLCVKVCEKIVCMYVRTYVCLYVHTYVCMYVSMYV